MFGLPRGIDAIVIIGILLLVFGNRLPSLGKSLGKGIVEFKKGLKGLEDEVNDVHEEVRNAGSSTSERTVASAPNPYAPRQIETRAQAPAPSTARNKQKQEA